MYINKFILILLFLSAFTFTVYSADVPEISAESSVLIDGDTSEILYEKNSTVRMSMASTTKIMTVLIAIESGKLNDIVTVKDRLYIEGTAIGFEVGDKITVETLCYGALLESGNDAAVLIAEYFSGSEDKFSKIMNTKAHEIGMEHTNFVTASGLDAQEHYTTAYDMAVLGAYAVKNDKFRDICSSKTYKAEFISGDKIRYFSNHNKLLKTVDGVFGIKTGFTKKSGRCLVSACERDGKVLIAVTLKAPDDWNDHEKLYVYGYSLYERRELDVDFISDRLKIIGSDKDGVKIKFEGNESFNILKNADLKPVVRLRKFYYAPIKNNDILGEIEYYQNGRLLFTKLITADEDADVVACSSDKNIFKKILSYFTEKAG